MTDAFARIRYLSKYWLMLLPLALMVWFDWSRHWAVGLYLDAFIVAVILIAVLKFVVSNS